MFCDRLDAHMSIDSMAKLKEAANMMTWGTAAACSEHTNPIDRGYGAAVKREISHIVFEEYLQDDDNLALWEKGHSASDIRILLTTFVGEAVRRVNAVALVQLQPQRAPGS